MNAELKTKVNLFNWLFSSDNEETLSETLTRPWHEKINIKD